MTGLEPVNLFLTKEVLYQLSYISRLTPYSHSHRAGNGIRTRDIQLGKLMLYQLSYSRLNSNVRTSSDRPSSIN